MSPDESELDEAETEVESHIEETQVDLDEVEPETTTLDERFTRERVASDPFAAKSFNEHAVVEDTTDVVDDNDDDGEDDDSDDLSDPDSAQDASGASDDSDE